MWLLIFVVPLAIVMLIGGLLAGGIFTIVFLPIALIIVVGAVAFAIYGTSQGRRRLPSDEHTVPEPSTGAGTGTGHSNVPAGTSGPGELTDARRQAQ